MYQDGERVLYQNHKKNSNKNKLHRLWKVSGLRFDFAGTRRLSASGRHLVGPGDILPTGS